MTNASSNINSDRPGMTADLATAGDIMTTEIVSVPLGTSVRDVARLMLAKRVSAVPVLDVDDQLVGMVSEGDLLGRGDADQVSRRDWWLMWFGESCLSAESLDALVARPVEQVMRAPVMTIGAGAPLHEIAEMLRAYDIKRLPVVRRGRVVGIVSRADLVRAMAAMTPGPVAGRPLGGLGAMIAGMMKMESRPPQAPAAAAAPDAPPPITAQAFLTLVTASKQAEKDEVVEAKEQGKLELARQVEAMLEEHIGAPAWTALLARARSAATRGENSFELLRFPCDLCSDGGRKIGVPDADWPTTLRGEAAEFYTRWARDLRAAGFGLTAQIIEFVDGMPSNIALSLTWNDEKEPS